MLYNYNTKHQLNNFNPSYIIPLLIVQYNKYFIIILHYNTYVINKILQHHEFHRNKYAIKPKTKI